MSTMQRLSANFSDARPKAKAAADAVLHPRPPPVDPTYLSKEDKLKTTIQSLKELSKTNHPKSLMRYSKLYRSAVRQLTLADQTALIDDLFEDQKQYVRGRKEGLVAYLISLQGRMGKFDYARKLFDEMPDLNCTRSIHSLNALLDASIESNKFDKVEEIFKELPKQLSMSTNRVTYNTIIKAYCRMGSIESALEMFDELMNKGFEPNIVTFNTLLTGLYRCDRFTEADKIWALMEDKNVSPDTLTYCLKMRGLVSQNKLVEAVALFSDMTSRNIEPGINCFNVLICGFCRVGDVEEAKNWYHKLQQSKSCPDRVTMRLIIPLLLEKGDVEMAGRLCNEANNKGMHIGRGLTQNVVNKLVKDSKVESAKEVVRLCSSVSGIKYDLQMP